MDKQSIMTNFHERCQYYNLRFSLTYCDKCNLKDYPLSNACISCVITLNYPLCKTCVDFIKNGCLFFLKNGMGIIRIKGTTIIL